MALREDSSTILDARFLQLNGSEPLNGFPMGAPDGSLASPSFSFETSSTTGMSLNSDLVTFGVGGVSTLVVGMDGNVALGVAPLDYGVTTPGEGVLFVNTADVTPTAVPNSGSGGGVLYVDGNALKYTDGVNGTTVKLTSKTGDVFGPVSSVLTSVAVFDGITGKLIKDSPLLATASSTLQAPNGSNALNTYAFTGDEDTGVNFASGMNIVNGGSPQVNVGSTSVNIAVTGVEVHVPDGSVGTPAYAFSSYPTSGLYLNGTDVNISVNGSLAMAVEDVGGAVPNVSFGSPPSDYGAATPGVGVLFLPETGVVPSGIPDQGNGSLLFVSSNALTMLNSGGVVRILTNCAEEPSGTTTVNGVARFSGSTGKILQDTTSLTVAPAGQWTGPDGGLALTTYGFSGDADTGVYSSGVGVVDLVTGGTSRVSVSATEVTVNNAILLPDGSASQPVYSFTSAPSSGVYFDSTADSMCMSAGGQCGFASFEQENIAFGGDPVNSFGGGEGVLWLREATTVPSTNPSGGSLLYTSSTELLFRTPSGTVFNLTDEVTGDASSQNFGVVLFSGTSGKIIQNCLANGGPSGKLHTADGSVSAPAFSFTSTVDAGMYDVGTDVYLSVAGGVGGVGQLGVDGSAVLSAVPFLVPYGTSSTPSITFAGDEDTGFYRGFTNRLSVSVGGVPGLAFTSAGVGANVSLTGTSSFATGQNVVFIEEVGVSPVGTLPSGGILYVSGTDLMFHDDTGVVSALNSSPTAFIDGPVSSVVDSVAYWSDTGGQLFNSGSVSSTATQTSASGYYVNDTGANITNDTSRVTLTSGVGKSVMVGSTAVEVTGIPLHADTTLRVGGGSGVSESVSGSVFTSNHLNAAGTFEWRRDGSEIFSTSGLNVTTPNSYVFPSATELMDIGNTSGTTYTVSSTTSGGTADDISLSVDGVNRVVFEQNNSVLGNSIRFPTQEARVLTRVEAPDGSIALPSYTFDSLPTSGMMYDSATSSVGFAVDGNLCAVASDAGAGSNVAFAVSAFPTTYNGGVNVVYIGEAVTPPSGTSNIGTFLYVSDEDDFRNHTSSDENANATVNAVARRCLSTLSYSPFSGSTVSLIAFNWTDIESVGAGLSSDGAPFFASVDTTVMAIAHATWASNSTGYRKVSITTGLTPVVEATTTTNAVNGDVTSQTVTLIRRITSGEPNLVFAAEIFQNSGGNLNADMTFSLTRMN